MVFTGHLDTLRPSGGPTLVLLHDIQNVVPLGEVLQRILWIVGRAGRANLSHHRTVKKPQSVRNIYILRLISLRRRELYPPGAAVKKPDMFSRIVSKHNRSITGR